MRTVYYAQIIEVEFGQRPEGCIVALDVELLKRTIKKLSDEGAYADGGGYYGPERPLGYYECPLFCLDATDQLSLETNPTSYIHTRDHWQPKFKTSKTLI